ncbi:MAG: hypothetical protein GQ570_11420 [Helicobacteraceae bacterium]|nr:hypothetical protein [Helicobacteraceae bacterium]
MKILKLILLTLSFFINNLLADTFTQYSSNIDLSDPVIYTININKNNDHDQFTITLIEDGALSLNISGDSSDKVKFAFSSTSMPTTQSNDGTLTSYGPTDFVSGTVIYASVHAPTLDKEDISYSITFTLSSENSAPTDITLSNASISENAVIGTTVGTFSTTDVDIANTFSYSLVGGADDASFSISGSNLVSNTTFNYATKSLYSILVRTDDGAGGTYDKNFDISIIEGAQPTVTASQIFSVDDGTTDGFIVGTIETTNSPTAFSITNDSSDGNFSISNLGVITVLNSSELDVDVTPSYTLGIFASNDDGSDEKNITINVTHILAPVDSNTYGCDMFGSVIVTYDYLDVSGTANAQACGTENISYPSGQITGSIDCLSDIACGGDGTECERIDPPANQLTYTWTHPNSPILDESPINPTPLTDMSYGNIAYSSGSAVFNASTLNPNNGNNYMYIGDATFDQTLISFTSGDYYFESFSITKNKNDVNNFAIDSTNGPVRIFIKNNLSFELNNLYLNHSGTPSDLLIYVGGDFNNPGSGGGNTHMNAYFYVEGDVLLNNNSNNWIIEGGITAEGTITIAGNNPDFIQSDESGDLGYGACSLCFKDVVGTATSPYNVSNSFVNLKGSTIYDLNVYKTYTGTNIRSGCSSTDGSCAQSSVSVDFDNLDNFVNGNSYSGYQYNIGDYDVFQFTTIEDNNTHIFNLTEYDTSITVNSKIDVGALFIADYYDTQADGKFYHTIVEECQLGTAGNLYIPGVLDAVDTDCINGTADTLAGCAENNITTKVSGRSYDLNILDVNTSSNMLFGTALAYLDDETISYKYIGEVNATDEGGITTFTIEHSDSVNSWSEVSNIFATKEAWIQFYFCNSSPSWRDCYVVGGDNVYITKNEDANESSSHDKFSIRPKLFNIELNASDILTLKSDENYKIDVNATYDLNSTNVIGYIQTLGAFSDKNASNILAPSDPLCTLSDEENFDAIFTNGVASSSAFTYNNVGDINITLLDSDWTMVDQVNSGCTLNSSSTSITPVGCNIESVKQVVFTPYKFNILGDYNNSANGFTYYSNDLTQGALLDLNISAVNKSNEPTTNYTALCFAKDVNVTISSVESGVIYGADETPVVPIVLGEGNFSDANATLRVYVNFSKDNSIVKNPIQPDITALAQESENSTIQGEKLFTNGATFIYARAHIPRMRTSSDEANATLYYEFYCGDGCTLNDYVSFSPTKMQSLDDIKWYKNENHTSADGNITASTQRSGETLVTSVIDNNNAKIIYTYNETKGYPYKSTMQVETNSWLLFHPFNSATTANYFELEFNKENTQWNAEANVNTAVDANASTKTNRRIMW